MRVVVTGASGFVGREVARRHVAGGDDVWVACRRPPLAPLGGTSVVAADFTTDEGRGRIAAARPDVCVHCAWHVEPGNYLSSLVNVDMAASTVRLADTLARAGCQRFVGIGTCFEYEMSAEPLREDCPLAPAHLYASAKLGTYLMLREVGRARGTSVAWVRLFYLFGPREDSRRLVPSVIGSILRGSAAEISSGVQVRDYLHVADAAAGIVAAAMSDLTGPVNVCSDEAVTVAGVAGAAADLMGRPDLLRLGARPQPPDDPPVVRGDSGRLRAATGWRPRYDLRSGLENVIEWWRRAKAEPATHMPDQELR